MKRRIPLLIVIGVGFLTLFGHFINHTGINNFVNNDATQWFDIITAFALFLGSLNLMRIQFNKVLKRKKNWQYSIITIVGFLFAIYAGFFFRGTRYVAIFDIEEASIGELSKIISEETNNDSSLVANNIGIYNQGFEIPYKFKDRSNERAYLKSSEIQKIKIEGKDTTISYDLSIRKILNDIKKDIIKDYVDNIRYSTDFIVPIDFSTLDSAKLFANKYSLNYSIDYSVYDYMLKIYNVSNPDYLIREITKKSPKIMNNISKINLYKDRMTMQDEFMVPMTFRSSSEARFFSGKDSTGSSIDSTYYHYMLRLTDVSQEKVNMLSEEIAQATTFYFADGKQTKKYEKLEKFKYDMEKDMKAHLKGFPISKIFMMKETARIFADKISAFGKINILSKTWGAHVSTEGSLFYWIFQSIFTPLSATMFALLAFFVASASYRAFRIRNIEATLLLGSGILLMLGRVPIGEVMTGWAMLYIMMLVISMILAPMIRDKRKLFFIISLGLISISIIGLYNGFDPNMVHFMSLPIVQEWIFQVPTIAGARAIMIGIALGIVGTSVRIIFGIERSFLGDGE